MLKYLFLGLFCLTSLIHLYHSYINDKKNRAKTKPFLLIFLILYYVTAAKNINAMLLAALIASWLGDVPLIPDGHKWFIAGGISFLISHVFFIFSYVPGIIHYHVNWLIVIPLAIVYFTIAIRIIMAVKDNTPKMMLIPMNGYLWANSIMNVFALMQWMTLRNTGSLVAYVGAVLFFTSDCLLFLVRYHKNKDHIWRKHFLVMATYLIGELLITAGMLMIGG
jgi:uncharacterized membrane protein YhhN